MLDHLTDQSDTPLPTLPPREANSHKGTFGKAMLLGGSQDMPGAIAMAGLACLRAGAGLVTLGVPRCAQQMVANYSPAYMTRGLVDDEPGVLYWANCFDLEPIVDKYDVWAIGPGLGSPEVTGDLVGRMHRDFAAPLVIDADALNGLVLFFNRYGMRPTELIAPRILTPHPGEFARLIDDEELAAKATGNDEDRIDAAATLSRQHGIEQTIVVLKGHRTVVTDGRQFAVNTTGNPGMATGGSGDVLTGILTALIAQGLAPFDAARLAVYLHGMAGDLAAETIGQVSIIATDLIESLPQAIRTFEQEQHQ